MPKYIWEISASSWFYYREICYDARSHERKKLICEISVFIWFYYREICYDARSHERKKKP